MSAAAALAWRARLNLIQVLQHLLALHRMTGKNLVTISWIPLERTLSLVVRPMILATEEDASGLHAILGESRGAQSETACERANDYRGTMSAIQGSGSTGSAKRAAGTRIGQPVAT